jgi:hypothetical protein
MSLKNNYFPDLLIKKKAKFPEAKGMFCGTFTLTSM